MCKNSVMPETSEDFQEAKAPARGGVGQPTLRIPRLLLLGCVCDLDNIILLFVMLTLRVLDLIAGSNLSSLLYCSYLDFIFLSQIWHRYGTDMALLAVGFVHVPSILGLLY